MYPLADRLRPIVRQAVSFSTIFRVNRLLQLRYHMEQFRVHNKNPLLTGWIIELILPPKYYRYKGDIMDSGHAKIRVTDETVLVRFDDVSSPIPGAFEALRDRFYSHFPNARWVWSLRRMVLPRHDLNRLIAFCAHEFGADGVRIEYQPSERRIGFELRL